MADLHTLHTNLVNSLDTTDAIRAAFADHARHRFIPNVLWPDLQGLPLIRSQDPKRWASYVYTDDSVVTQANDGGSGRVNTPTSSSSAPQLMADMIASARVEPGMRVLEIGTGTGWNAAILAALVGPTGHVTTLEIDQQVADRARSRLEGTGVQVIAGAQVPDAGTYDALIATCAVTRIPDQWLEATSSQAMIVVPWGPSPLSYSTPVAALSKQGRGVLEGPFVCEAFFMRDRTQRLPDEPFPGVGSEPEYTQVLSFTPQDLEAEEQLTRFMLTCPGVWVGVGRRPFSGANGWILGFRSRDGSWAYLWPDGSVTGAGATPLPQIAADTYKLLDAAAWPSLNTFSLRVDTTDGMYQVRTGFGTWYHPQEI